MSEPDPPAESGDGSPGTPVHLRDAGAAAAAWITLLTTEHYNLQTQRAATITESNGRASVFLGAVSAGLISLGFATAHTGRSAGTVFEALVLSALTFLGLTTFVRVVEVSLDDWMFAARITSLRAVYAQLVPEIADLLAVAAGMEQAGSMLTPRRQPLQVLLGVAGSVGVITSVLLGADIGVLIYGPSNRLGIALVVGAVTAFGATVLSVHFQRARWQGVIANQPA